MHINKIEKGLVFLTLLLITIACNKEQESKKNIEIPDITYQVEQEMVLPIPDTVAYTFDFWDIYYPENRVLLAGLFDNNIEIFDVNEQRFFTRIHLEKTGLNGVGDIGQFYLHNMDSVFVFSKSKYTVYLVDKTGDIVDTYNVNESLKSDSEALSIECFRNYGDKMLYNPAKKELLLRTYPPYDLVKNKKTYQVPYKIQYRIDNKKITNFFGIFPDEFSQTENYYSNDYQISYCNNDDKHLFSFRRDHHIYELNTKTNKVKQKHLMKSKYIDEKFDLIPRNADFSTLLKHHRTAPAYENILYNKERKHYYRLVKHAGDDAKTDASIIIFDESFTPLGEMLLPKGKYFIASAKTYKNGILLYKYDKKEPILSFDLITYKLPNS